MATTTVATANDLVAAVAAYGTGDTIYVADGTYTFTAVIEKTSGGIPSIVAVNPWAVIFRWTKTYSWTLDGDEYYCAPDKAGGSHTPYEQPWGLWSADGTPYKQACSGFRPYDFASPPLGNQFDVVAGSFPTPDNTSDFEVRCYRPFDVSAHRASVSGSVVTVTNLLNEAQATTMDWQSSSDYATLAKRGYAVMNRSSDMRPGTWRWDSTLARLYVMPLPGETVNNLRVPQDIRRGLRLSGADSFRVYGIILEGLNSEPHWGPIGYSDDGALFIRDAEDVEIMVRVRNVAGAAIQMKELTEPPGTAACHGAYVHDCTVTNVGGMGIVVSGESSRVENNTLTSVTTRTMCSPAIVGQFVRSARFTGNTTRKCAGGSIHVAADNDDAATGPYIANHSSYDDMTNQLGDRGNLYFIGRANQGGEPAIVTGLNWVIDRSTNNGSGDHGVYFDEGSYGTINGLRMRGFGSRLGWYDSTKNNITPASGTYDAYSGRTIFWNTPEGPTSINGGTLVGDRITIDSRNSAETVTLNGVKILTRSGTLTNGTITRTGSPGVIDPP